MKNLKILVNKKKITKKSILNFITNKLVVKLAV